MKKQDFPDEVCIFTSSSVVFPAHYHHWNTSQGVKYIKKSVYAKRVAENKIMLNAIEDAVEYTLNNPKSSYREDSASSMNANIYKILQEALVKIKGLDK